LRLRVGLIEKSAKDDDGKGRQECPHQGPRFDLSPARDNICELQERTASAPLNLATIGAERVLAIVLPADFMGAHFNSIHPAFSRDRLKSPLLPLRLRLVWKSPL
jgi:hypothetical protein